MKTIADASHIIGYDGDDKMLVSGYGNGAIQTVVGTGTVAGSPDGSSIVAIAYSHTSHAFFFGTWSGVYKAVVNGGPATLLAKVGIGAGLAIDASDTPYFIDGSGAIAAVRNGQVQVITPANVAPPGGGQVADPTLTFDPSDGALYVADSYDTEVKRVTTSGVVSVVAGACVSAAPYGCWSENTPGTGPGVAFGHVSGIAYGNGQLYVADSSNNELWSLTTSGTATIIAGYGPEGNIDGNGLRAFLDKPEVLAFANDSGLLYIGEVSYPTRHIATYATTGLPQPAYVPPTLRFPTPTLNSQPLFGAAAPDGSFWFAESIAARVGHATTSGITEYALTQNFRNPWLAAVDANGNAWVSAQQMNGGPPTGAGFVEVTPSGVVTPYFAKTLGGIGFPAFGGLAVGSDGRPWFTEGDLDGSSVGTVDAGGQVTQYTLTPPGIPIPPATPGPIAQAVVAGPDGNLWFSTQNQMGRINSLGQFLSPVAATGPIFAMAKSPADGSIWFVEGSATIGHVAPNGTVSTFDLTVRNFQPYPVGITVDGSGNAWVAEQNFGDVARVTPAFAVTRYLVPQSAPGVYGIAARSDGKIWISGIQGSIFLLDPAAYDAGGFPHPSAVRPDPLQRGMTARGIRHP